MPETKGCIYILTNPAFRQYVKIGYSDNVQARLKTFNRSPCVPLAFRLYATYETEARLTDKKLHEMIDRLNPALRLVDDVNGVRRVREFYAMSPETAYTILETIAELGGRRDKLKRYDLSTEERQNEELAQEIEEERIERLSPFAFSKCNIPIGATVTFYHHGNPHSGTECTVADDRNVEYQGRKASLSAWASEWLGGGNHVAGPRYFKYNGKWLNMLRAQAEGRISSAELDNAWIIPCNPGMYDIVHAFENLNVIEWSQSTNTTVGDIVYLYVGGEYKAILYKCEVVAADLHGNRTDEDLPYYKNLVKDPDARYMKLKRLSAFPSELFPLRELRSKGLRSVQGRSKVSEELLRYLEEKERIFAAP